MRIETMHSSWGGARPDYIIVHDSRGRYLNIFLGEDGKTTRKKIKFGEYKLKELNK